MENPFVKLFAIDFKDHLEVKKSGSTELKYVSWAYAWAEVKKLYPSASYEVKKFNGLPYVYDHITGFMVYTSVTIEGVSHEMWLPVLDGANKAMKAVPYTYTTPKWDYNPQTRRREKVGMEERTVEAAEAETHQPKAGTAAYALHLRPMQSAHQTSKAERWLYHAGGRVCEYP